MGDDERWRRRFETFAVNDVTIARDRPDRGLVAAGGIDPHQLLAWDRSTGVVRQVTDESHGILRGWLSADGEWIYWVDDPEQREEGILVRAPWAGGEPQVVDPELGPGFVWDVIAHGSQIAFSVLVDGVWQHRVAQASGEGSRLVATDPLTAYVAAFADDGRALVTARWMPDGERETVLYDVDTGAVVASLSEPGVTLLAYTPSPLPGDTRVLAESSESGTRRPFVWDRATGGRMPIPTDGLEGDVRSVDWSPDGSTVLLLQVHRAETRLHLVDLATGARHLIETPPGALTALPTTFATCFAGPEEIVALWQDGSHPAAVLSIPLDGRRATIALGDAEPPPGHRWQNVSFPSGDGTLLQGWLATPDGEGPFPAVVDIHGGPAVGQLDWFIPQLQAFVDQGFAVLSVNYRGSATFGTAFQDAIKGRPGELEVEDVVAAAEYLVASGVADPGRILVEGWSYGGYLTLMAMSLAPDRWAGGICGVGIADMAACHAEAATFIADMLVDLLGGTPAEVPDRYATASPITYVDRVRAPLLVIHGRNDIRCPAGQMEGYLARLAALHADVETEWFSAGHMGGVADPALDREHTARMLEFAERVAGGRQTATSAVS